LHADGGADRFGLMEFVLIVVGTFLGAAVALSSDLLVKRYEAKLKEETAINNLLLDLAAKRSLASDANIVWAPGAGARIVESVNHTRGLVRETRLNLLPRSRFLAPLRRMARACATFMEQTEYYDDEPRMEDLAELRRALRIEAAAIHRINPRRIVNDQPGDFALSREIDRGGATASTSRDGSSARRNQ
jgi:hypothetical protein